MEEEVRQILLQKGHWELRSGLGGENQPKPNRYENALRKTVFCRLKSYCKKIDF